MAKFTLLIKFKLLLIPLILIVSSPGFSEVQSNKPNFLIIFTDDQTYRAIGYKNDLVQTPNLDELARKGMIFNLAFTSTPICAASRASILTGLYPQTNGTVALDTKSFTQNIVEEKKFQTLPHLLNAAGYATYMVTDEHEEALFHSPSDPYEKNNRINHQEDQEIVRRLKGFYMEWKILVGEN